MIVWFFFRMFNKNICIQVSDALPDEFRFICIAHSAELRILLVIFVWFSNLHHFFFLTNKNTNLFAYVISCESRKNIWFFFLFVSVSVRYCFRIFQNTFSPRFFFFLHDITVVYISFSSVSRSIGTARKTIENNATENAVTQQVAAKTINHVDRVRPRAACTNSAIRRWFFSRSTVELV